MPSPRAAHLPEKPASELFPGEKRKGRDGHFYRVAQRSNGVNYWQKCGPKATGGSFCRFVGPMRNPAERKSSPKRRSSPKKASPKRK